MRLRDRIAIYSHSTAYLTLPLAWRERAGGRYVAAGLRLPGRHVLYIDWGRAPGSGGHDA